MGSLTQTKVVFGLVLLLWSALSSPLASAESITLSVNTVREPPRDLLDPYGNPLDPGAAAQMPDLSLLNPSPDKRWQDRRYPIEDPSQGPLSWGYPTAAQGVRFLEHDRENTFTYTAKVQSPTDPSRSFRLTLSRFVHPTLMRAALMRLLGYYVPSPKLYRDLKIRFPSKEKMEEFITTAQGAMTSDFKTRGMIRAKDDKNFILTVSEAVLEPNTPNVVDYFNFHWGFLPTVNAENAAAISGLLQQWGQSRAHRAMIGAMVLVDVPEAVNRYSAKAATTWAGTVILTHPSAGAFKATTFEDVRWLVRRMSTLTAQDLRAIVKYAGYPAEVDDLVYAKLVHRFLNLHEHFKVPAPALEKPALKFTGPARIVVAGKVAKEYVDGHPERFSHGEREMPFENSDLWRYLSIEGISTGAKKLFGLMTDRLQAKTVADLSDKRGEQVLRRIKDHVAKNPFEALYQEKETWGGPIGGINFDASRHLTTGTYFESQAPIQLVDNFSIGATLGYFRALDGIEGYFPTGGGNVTITRDYTHVRPLDTVKQGTSVSWVNLNVPGYMYGLGELLEENSLEASAEKAGEKKKYALDKVLAELKKGEVFSVTDSIALNLFASFGTTFQFLLGKDPTSLLNTVSLGADGGRIGLRQTTFTRTDHGVQVYIRKQGTWQGGLTFDANYFLNLLRLRASTQNSSIHTDAYLINYIPELSADLPTSVDKAKKDASKQTLDMIRTKTNLRLALAALLKSNDSELLEANFQDRKPTLEHEIVTNQFAIKALTERRTSFTESHKLKLNFPAVVPEPAPSPSAVPAPSLEPPAAPPGLATASIPAEEVAVETNPTVKSEDVVLYGYKSGVLTGRDFIGTIFDAIEGLFKKTNVIARVDNPNPANSIFGRGYWKIINTEMDLSPIEKPYPSVGIIQNVWGGWHMARDSFLELLEEIQRRYPGARMGVERIIETEAFTDTKSLDFYRVTANMTIFNEGLAKIRDLVLQPETARKDARDTGPQSGIFAWLREAIKLGPKKDSDEAFVRALMTLMGDGDYELGKSRYLEQCQNMGSGGGEDGGGRTAGARWYGQNYECMSDWLSELLSLRRSYPGQAEFLADGKAKFTDEIRQDQLRWVNQVIEILEKQVPLSALHSFVGEANAIFYVRINGFRVGDEDGDLEFFSNAPGDPTQDFELADGIFNLYAKKTGISAVEIDRSQAPFR